VQARRFGLVAILLLGLGCSGGEPSTPEAPPVPQAPAVIQPSLLETIPRDSASMVTVQTLPDAVCNLDARDAPDTEHGLTLLADEDGAVSFEAQPVAESSQEAKLALDCRAPDGARWLHPITLRQGSARNRADVGVAVPRAAASASRTLRPALAEDPTTLTTAELLARGFPPRPDPVRSADTYARWLRSASQPMSLIAPRLVPRPGRFHGPATNGNAEAANWSGLVLAQPGVAYDAVYGWWDVPRVYAQSDFWSFHYSSTWVGIDGWASSDVVQDGTEQDSKTIAWVQTSNYSVWIEWFPEPELSVSNLPVNPGDRVEAWAWVGDVSGNPDVHGGFGWFYLTNDSTHSGGYANIPIPSGTTFVANSAEWIEERPAQSGSLSSLANYSSAAIHGIQAYDETWTLHQYTTDTYWQLNMYDGTHDLSQVTLLDASDIAFQWLDYQ
jgi:hypothetical protein